MIDQYALWIGRVVMIGAGGIVAAVLLLAAWGLAGYIGADVFKRLRRIYNLRVIDYWLDRLEKQGPRVFQKAEQEDVIAKEAMAARGRPSVPPMRDMCETDAEFRERQIAWKKHGTPS